ncbi:MAG: helix-turn-helix domain-containing protein [Ilumatobacter sp.]|uniref:winged helix-turn-helix transcriptional regulator n=1 Tax=Ilumatobacter sp. TaxID=1967498 RepID=UPI0026232D24|nr:helix-turn-helix domain-containing protein [Ilumatobacter sp.]MDJ0769684.1 helix-turn-helix domain-containing protein [Ilumatobacter sp.]
MRRTRFDRAHCPVARTTDLLGDWWTPIVLRELLLGRRRFNDIQERLDISRATLSQRLKRLEAEQVVERVQYAEHPDRFEYRLTDKGRALWEVVVAMWQFGDDWMFAESSGAQIELIDKRTGQPIRAAMVDATTGEPLDLASTRVRLRR